MTFSSNDIKALVIIAGSKEPVNPGEIRKKLSLQRETVSRLVTHLVNNGLAQRDSHEALLAGTAPAEAFKRLYYSHRGTPLHKVLTRRRLELLARLEQNPKSLETLANETKIAPDTLYGYLKGFVKLGVISRSKKGKAYYYSFNFKLWKELKDFVNTFDEYQLLRLVPREALLIKRYEKSVLFKSIRIQNATATSFSAYEDYGIALDLRDYYYTLPEKPLSITEIFIHSLDSAEESFQKLFCVLFYLKNRDKMETVDHPMMKDIEAVLHGESIRGYPALEDIQDRLDLYDIRL